MVIERDKRDNKKDSYRERQMERESRGIDIEKLIDRHRDRDRQREREKEKKRYIERESSEN